MPRRPSRATTRDDPAVELPAAPTLSALVRDLGQGILGVLSAPNSLDVAVGESIVFDAASPPPIETCDIVFAVGVAAGSPASTDLVRRAGAAGAAAVVVKAPDDSPQALIEAASDAGVALLSIPQEMEWAHCLSLVRTAVASSGTVPERGPGGVAVGDLFALANAVSAIVGGAVTIEDPQSRVLAYSSLDEPIDEPRRQTILGRRVPEPWMKRLHEAGVFRRLWTTDEVVRFEHPDEQLRPRLAIAVRAGGEILGSVWVAEGRKVFDAQAEEALREAARVAALHLIRHRTTDDLERRMRGDLLRSVLEGRGPVGVVASHLGVEAKARFTVIAFELGTADEGLLVLQRERTVELITMYSEAFRRRGACTAIGRVVYVLLPTPSELGRDRLRVLAREMVDNAAEALDATLAAGIGSTVTGLRQAPQSRWEADQALRVLRAGSVAGPVADIDAVRGQALLIELQDLATERPHLRAGKLERLVEHDAEHGTAYVDTLRAYLGAFGDVPRAAGLVRVHPNTFRYRIRRLVEISGIDLDNPQERLAAEIQLQFLEPPAG